MDKSKESEGAESTEEEKQKTADEILREVIIDVVRTPSGKELFRHLHDFCGFAKSDIRFSPTGDVNTTATAFNSAVRNVYVHLRERVPKDLLIDIEYKKK